MENPLSLAFVGLWLALPGVWLAGRALVRAAHCRRAVAAVVTPGAALAVWLVPVHAIGRGVGRFSVGLWVGTLAVGALGLGLWLHERRTTGPRARRASARPEQRWMLFGALVAMALLTPVALRWALHDELLVLGHRSIPAQFQNDVYPPRHPSFPAFELRYHYGFDLLVAIVTALGRLSVDWAIDVTTIGCWGYTYCLLWVLGERLLGRRAGHWLSLCVLFGAGLPYFCSGAWLPSAPLLASKCMVEGLWLNPPLFSYFFQHPWSLGLPLGLGVLLVASDPRARGFGHYALLGLLLVALSFSQFVLFLSLGGTLVVREVALGLAWRTDRARPRLTFDPAAIGRVAATAGMLGAALLVASQLGGFFAPSHAEGSELLFRPGLVETPGGLLRWLGMTFGLLLPLGLLGIALLRHERVTFATLAGGSLLCLLLFRLRHGWDIVKFATLAAIALGVGTSVTVTRLWRARPRWLGRTIGALCVAGSTSAGFGFAVVYGVGVDGIDWQEAAPPLAPDDRAALGWLRTHVRPGELVLSGKLRGWAYALWGGVPVPWLDPAVHSLAVGSGRIAEREQLFARPPLRLDEYRRQGIRWIVVAPEDDWLQAIVREATSRREAEERARFGALRIYAIDG